MTRKEIAALNLRDTALVLFRDYRSSVVLDSSGATLRFDDLVLLYSTPFRSLFQHPRKSSFKTYDDAEFAMRNRLMPYMLNIWDAKITVGTAKVFNMDWDGDQFKLVSFHRGAWEYRLDVSNGSALIERRAFVGSDCVPSLKRIVL